MYLYMFCNPRIKQDLQMNLQPNASMLDVPPTNGEPSLLIPKRKNPTAAPLQAEVLDAFNKNKEQLIQIGKQSAVSAGGACKTYPVKLHLTGNRV